MHTLLLSATPLILELLALVCIDYKGCFQLAETLVTGTEYDSQLVLAAGNAELIFIAKRLLLEFLHFRLAVEVKIYGIAEACRN